MALEKKLLLFSMLLDGCRSYSMYANEKKLHSIINCPIL